EVTPVAATGTSTGTAVASAGTSILNNAPTASAVSASGTVTVGNTLTGSYTYNDVDGDSEGTSTFRWLRNNVAITSATSSTYMLVAADSGTTIKFEVTPVAATGTTTGTAITSAGTSILNSAPVFTGTPAITGTGSVGNTLSLTGTTTSDVDGNTVALTYQWRANGVNIAAAIAATYTLTSAEAHKTITCVVTANDGVGAGNSMITATTAGVALTNATPVLLHPGIHGLILQNNATGTLNFSVSDADTTDTHTYAVSTAANGTISFAGNVLTYNSTIIGSETLSITVQDNFAGTSIVFQLPITVNDPAATANDAPAASGTGLTITQSLTIGLDPNASTTDYDGDGLDDSIEIGDPANPTDDDNDGVPDVFENGALGNDASTASGLQLSSGSLIINSAGETISNASHSAASGTLPADTTFPYGIITYNTTAPVGGSKTVRLTFTTALPANLMLYKVDNASVFTLLPSSAWVKIDANTVDITLTDGDAATDLDGVANGIIIDPLALGSASTLKVGGGGCTLAASNNEFDPLFPLMLILSSFWYAFRRKDEKPSQY
ncbi:MAG: choice-of-anchor U domain-containing protein, partial [Mariprofundaceae bacterium]